MSHLAQIKTQSLEEPSMSKPQTDERDESNYLEGYPQGTLDAMRSSKAISHIEPWDCANVNLSEWLSANGTWEFSRKSQR